MSLKQYFLFTFFFLFLVPMLLGQTKKADLSGTVALEKEQVIGAYILIEDTDFAGVTDEKGKYEISNIPFGDYTIKVSYVGTEDLAQEITIDSRKQTLDFELESTTVALETATVTAKSGASIQKDQPIQIESIELKGITGRVKDLTEAIERLPGINVRGSGSFGDRADVTINGLNGTAVRTYIDGLPLEFVYPAFSITNIPIDNISRVDVYKGVIPIDVGTDALGGGVNIITQQKPYNEVKASYGYGSFNTHQANLTASYLLADDITISANTTYNYSDNDYTMDAFVWEAREEQEVRRFHDAYRLFFAEAALDIRNKSWADKFRVSVNYNDFYKEVQNGGAITRIAFGSVDYSGGSSAYSLIYNKKLGDKITLETTTNYNDNRVIFADTTANIFSWSGEVIKRDERQRGELAENSLTDRDFNNFVNRINLTWKISPNDELLLSNLVAQQSTIGRDETESVEEDFLTRRQFLQKDILGLQYQRKWLNQRLITAVAGKWYFYKLEGVEPFSFTDVLTNEDQLGYYASAKYNFTDNFFIRASYESALRIPTFDQFFGNGASVLSNPELKPESSDNANLGFSFRSKKRGSFSYGLTANGFLRGQNELIFLNNEIFQQFRNAEDVRTIGVEGEVFFEFWEKLRLQYNVTRLSQTYESINESNVSSQFLVGTPFPNNPNFFMNARLSYDLPQLLSEKDGLRIYTQYKYVDEFNFINVGQIYDPANFVPVQHRLDAGLVYSLFDNKISLAFNANNILDADIFDIFSIPRPGRNFNFKITYTFQDF